jgi:hypothetical protein
MDWSCYKIDLENNMTYNDILSAIFIFLLINILYNIVGTGYSWLRYSTTGNKFTESIPDYVIAS